FNGGLNVLAGTRSNHAEFALSSFYCVLLRRFLYKMQQPLQIAVVGSGLVGSLLAIYLRKAGHSVHVYDRSKDIRTVQFSGRSINLAMSHRGWRALDRVGVGDAIREIAIPMFGRAIHLETRMSYQAYGREGEAIYSISRGTLNRKMIDLAEEAGAQFHFEQ